MAQVSHPEIRELLEAAADRAFPEITPDSNLREMGVDSLAMVSLVVEVQRRFGVRIPDEQVPNLDTPQAVAEAILEASRRP